MSAEQANARRVALGLAVARVGIGVGAILATEPALKALLFGRTDAIGRALTRLAGGRDLAFGAATLAAREDPAALRRLTLTAALLDTADAFALALAMREPETRLAGLGGVLSGGGAALAGAWAARNLAAD